ncbi:unnamed protein product [Prorocentrum cordatum]|uniref:Sugar phosphate transporter domain-containing protein n=1 Tax=Prorocentrum cordatum TaxID=2364126 RepID=A0ABN9VIU2_9DINO|nr:unnamed protein product [Polarella glacialis]
MLEPGAPARRRCPWLGVALLAASPQLSRALPRLGRPPRRRCSGARQRAVGTAGGAVQDHDVRRSVGRAVAYSAVLVVVYVWNDISVYLVGDHASRGHEEQTALFMSAAASIGLGLVVSFIRRGRRGVRDSVDPGSILKLLPVSASFAISLLGLLKSFPHFDGAFIKLVGQIKLPITAILSAIVLGRRYTLVQWQVIICICIACCSFTALRLDSRIAVASVPCVGLLWVFTWVVFNALATLFAEWAFKQKDAMPFESIMTHLGVGKMLTVVLSLTLDSRFQLGQFFGGWDWSTAAIVCTLVGDAWLSGLMVSRLSSVTKNVCKCCTVVVLYCVALATGRQSPVLSQVLGALMIVVLTATFATLSLQQGPRQAAPAASSGGDGAG